MSRRVTLTFDNGPCAGVTDRVLDILADRQVAATFFVIGTHLDTPDGKAAVNRALREQHRIGNHTLTHSFAFGDRPRADPVREIEGAQDRIRSLAGAEKLFRPFGSDGQIGPHLLSPAARDHLLAANYTTVLWNCVPGDWRDPIGWLERGVQQVLAEDWAVVVLHDMPGAGAARLGAFIDRLNDAGVEWRQDYPDAVVLTRAGKPVSLSSEHVSR